MSYYHSRTVSGGFESVIDRMTDALKEEGFGVLTDIDVRATLKKKLGVEFRNYRILGACNPLFAYQALQAEDRIGVMLPCSVIVQQKAEGQVEVAAVNPLEAMSSVGNPALVPIAQQVSQKLQNALQRL